LATKGTGVITKRRIFTAALVVSGTVLALVAAGCGGGSKSSSSTSTTANNSNVLAALVSDIGKFNDRSFNQSQLEGLRQAKKQLGVRILAKQSNSTSDYIPNLTAAVRANADITIAAGFLLADDLETVANQ
jgi:basic membrane protein A